MATIAVTKTYSSGSAKANIVFTYTYTIAQANDRTTATVSKLVVSLTQSGSGDDAKNMRQMALNEGLAAIIKFDGALIWSGIIHASGTTNINQSHAVTKTHAAQTKAVAITCADVSKSASISIPAKTSYKVTLNANGGTGGTASLTKWYGETLSLTSGFTAPTRTGYKFIGWGETSTATATASQYTGNAAKTYYAVWEKQITGISLNVTTLRVADGTATAEDDEGTWCYGTCTYSITGTAAADVVFTVSVTPNTPQIVQDTFTATKTEDNTLTGSFVFRASGCATDASYTFMVAATANNTSATQTVTKSQGNVLLVAYYVLDVLGDNYVDSGQRPAHGISFGAPCKDEGFHVAMPADFGTFPDKDPSTYALIIGNGTSDTDRSNALTVDWDGYIYPMAEKMADWIVEQGTSGIWTYRKWHSGIAECWGDYTASMAVNVSSAAYGGYRSNEISVNLPSGLFTARPNTNITFASSNGIWVNNMQPSSATKVVFFLSCGASQSAASRTVSIQCIGKWK